MPASFTAVTVSAFIGSLNFTVTSVFVATPAASFKGVLSRIVGAVVSVSEGGVP